MTKQIVQEQEQLAVRVHIDLNGTTAAAAMAVTDGDLQEVLPEDKDAAACSEKKYADSANESAEIM